MIDEITQELKIAMKSQNKPKIIGLRNILGKLKASQIDKGDKLNDSECIKILNSAAKQLKDSIRQYSDANRLDLIEKEEYELSLVKNYLPEPISEKKIELEILKVIDETNAKTMADMGKVMGIVMAKFSGSIDGNIVQKIVKNNLSK